MVQPALSPGPANPLGRRALRRATPLPSARVVYACTECGAQSSRWRGRCPDCGAWNTYAEERLAPPRAAGKGGATGGIRPTGPAATGGAGPTLLQNVEAFDDARIPSGLAELDRALGGGFVPGGVVLLGGEPGIGKSTLLLQVAEAVARTTGPVLYVTGEESPAQVRLRARRLGAGSDRLYVHAVTDVASVVDACQRLSPSLVVVDSVQALVDEELASAAGSVGQVRAVAGRVVAMAKSTATPIVLVGHINKEGALAGPKVLEHAVDTVLYFEGDRQAAYRLVRAAKNRYGAANEIGCFEMRDTGLAEVPNPSAWFLAERSGASGAAVSACVEGTRPLLVEVQALVADARFGAGRRTVSGADPNRLALLIAVLERRCGLRLGEQDAFLKVVGGVRLDEPAADLAMALALASSFLDRPIPAETAVFGEVGLGGEVRGVAQPGPRIREAARLGFSRIVLPAASTAAIRRDGRHGRGEEPDAIELLPVKRLSDAVGALLG